MKRVVGWAVALYLAAAVIGRERERMGLITWCSAGPRHRRGDGVVRRTTTLPARNIKAGGPRAANVE